MRDDILELRERRLAASTRAHRILAAANGRALTRSQEVDITAALDEAEELTRKINHGIDLPLGEGDHFTRCATLDEVMSRPEREAVRPDPSPAVERRDGPATSPRFRSMFPGLKGTGGFESVNEFLFAVHNGLYDARLRSMTGTVGSDGGFFVPADLAQQVLDSSLEGEIVRPLAAPWPMTSDTLAIPGVVHSDGTAGPYGGLGGWVAPGATISETNPKTRSVRLKANAVKILTGVENEVLADSGGRLDLALTDALAQSCGWHLDLGFIRGSGVGQPLGILNSPCLITVSKEGGQLADTITYANLCAMFARMHPAGINRAVWIVNSTAIPALLSLSVAVGTGGSVVPVMTQANGQFSILTRPVLFSEKASALGDLGDVIFADLSQYACGLRGELQLARSQHVGFSSDKTFYRAIVRADGQPTWDAAYTPKYGETVSPFVTLEARA